MYCNMCGCKVVDGSRFCPMCGSQLQLVVSDENEIKNDTSNNAKQGEKSVVNHTIDTSVERSNHDIIENRKSETSITFNQENTTEADGDNKKTFETKKTGNAKKVLGLIAVLALICVGYFGGKKLLAYKYYREGKQAVDRWIELTDNGKTMPANEAYEEIEELLDDINTSFKKCEKFGGNSKNKEFVKNSYLILSTYTAIKTQGFRDCAKEEWMNRLTNLAGASTGDNTIDGLLEIEKAVCEAALSCYDWDFQAAYEKVEWCEDSIGEFAMDIYYNSFAADKLLHNQYSDRILNGSLKVSEYKLLRRFREQKYDKYPVVVCKFDDSSFDFYGIDNNGMYSIYALDAQTDKDVLIQERTFTYESGKLYYEFGEQYIDELVLASRDDKVHLLSSIPDSETGEKETTAEGDFASATKRETEEESFEDEETALKAQDVSTAKRITLAFNTVMAVEDVYELLTNTDDYTVVHLTPGSPITGESIQLFNNKGMPSESYITKSEEECKGIIANSISDEVGDIIPDLCYKEASGNVGVVPSEWYVFIGSKGSVALVISDGLLPTVYRDDYDYKCDRGYVVTPNVCEEYQSTSE